MSARLAEWAEEVMFWGGLIVAALYAAWLLGRKKSTITFSQEPATICGKCGTSDPDKFADPDDDLCARCLDEAIRDSVSRRMTALEVVATLAALGLLLYLLWAFGATWKHGAGVTFPEMPYVGGGMRAPRSMVRIESVPEPVKVEISYTSVESPGPYGLAGYRRGDFVLERTTDRADLQVILIQMFVDYGIDYCLIQAPKNAEGLRLIVAQARMRAGP